VTSAAVGDPFGLQGFRDTGIQTLHPRMKLPPDKRDLFLGVGSPCPHEEMAKRHLNAPDNFTAAFSAVAERSPLEAEEC
jgi:hypothetical protein